MKQKRFLEIGKITNVHGLHGEIKVYPWCDDAAFLCSFEELYLDKNGEKSVQVQNARVQQNLVIMKFQDCNTREQAEKLKGTVLYMDREEVELEEGCYFIQDLIGLKVIDADSERIWGTLRDVMQTGANDVYEIYDEQTGKQYLAPAIPEVVLETNLEEGFMKIRPLKGLFEDAD
ncbi:MAG: 16S rRNA processing protein RimM [Oscillospiraceae bacterium]|nr:16S rRNA processing protein RimM [Oscillospiraceae bacterium]MBR7085397.1 16S rRNA processing protein RimM [Oscillospiraceae bacterium]